MGETLRAVMPWAVLLSVLLVMGGCRADTAATELEGVREPVVADRFYPGDAEALRTAVQDFLDTAVPPGGVRPLALVAPHAGYVYSAQIAADAYRQAMDFKYDVVVILGTNHTVAGFEGMSVYRGTGYRTPLGVVPIDLAVVDTLLAADPAITFDSRVHAREHSVEVQVPFVQVAFPGIKMVGAVVGTRDLATTRRLGRVLARALRGRRPLIVASSDLSHYPPASDARRIDHATLEAMASFKPDSVVRTIERQMAHPCAGLVTCACGEGDVLCALSAAQALGARYGKVVSYANSGDTVFGEPGRVVGYGSVIFTRKPVFLADPWSATAVTGNMESEGQDTLGRADREYLLRLARQTVSQYLRTETVPLPRSQSPSLRRLQGVFVTFHEHGMLRGCIGHMVEDTPLQLATARMALQAALRDPRFSPVTRDEVSDLDVEISVLTPFKRVQGPQDFVIGRDGVVLEKAGHRAVYLPQVAPEQGWTRAQTLSHLCQKAGLGVDCWREGAILSTFQAQVFAESSH